MAKNAFCARGTCAIHIQVDLNRVLVGMLAKSCKYRQEDEGELFFWFSRALMQLVDLCLSRPSDDTLVKAEDALLKGRPCQDMCSANRSSTWLNIPLYSIVREWQT